MTDKISVTVSQSDKTYRIVVGNPLGLHRTIIIDLSNAESIVSGLAEAASVGDQTVLAQLGQLAQRVEALEKLMKGDKAIGATS